MDINFENYLIPIIVIGCLCVGYVMKKWLPTDDRIIPTVLCLLGGISGVILFGFGYEGIVKGMLSGLASVGLHQAFHQFIKKDTFGEMTDEEAYAAIEENEELADEVAEFMEDDEDE